MESSVECVELFCQHRGKFSEQKKGFRTDREQEKGFRMGKKQHKGFRMVKEQEKGFGMDKVWKGC